MIHSKITPELQTANVIYKIQYRVECYKTTVIQCCYVNCYYYKFLGPYLCVVM